MIAVYYPYKGQKMAQSGTKFYVFFENRVFAVESMVETNVEAYHTFFSDSGSIKYIIEKDISTKLRNHNGTFYNDDHRKLIIL